MDPTDAAPNHPPDSADSDERGPPTPRPPAGARYHFSLPVHVTLLVIFGGIAWLFGWLVYQTITEWRLAPPKPRPMTVAAAAALGEPGPVAWITLLDARWACERPLLRPSSAYSYGLATGAGGQRIVVALPGGAPAPCPSSAPTPLTGRLTRREAGDPLPATVAWSDLQNEHPDGPVLILWTDWTPPGGIWSAVGIVACVLLALFGLGVFIAALANLAAELRAVRVPRRPRLQGARFCLPLSTGASALGIFSLSFGGFQIFTFGWLFFLTVIPDWLGLVVGVLAAGWVLATFGAFIEGWKRRASDLLLGPAGCEIRGGPLHGVQHRWEDLAPEFCRLQHQSPGATDPQEGAVTLIIQGEVAAISCDAAEDRSLESIVQTLHGVADRSPAPAEPRQLQVVCCPRCGAPVPPRESAACPYCGSAVALPAKVLLQLRALAAHDRDRSSAERLLRRVLRQPPAWSTNALLVLLLPPLVLSWPVAGAVFDEFYQSRHILRPYHGLALAMAALCGNLALQFLLRARVAARAAVRIIATHFAALPPAQPGASPGCRVCAAPLVPVPGRLLLLCVYCGAENVTGLNLVPVAARQAAQAGALREALVERLRVRRRWRWRSLAALLLLAVCALSLWPVREALQRRPAGVKAAPSPSAGSQPTGTSR